MTDPAPSKDQVSQAWDDLNALVTFAYEQGFHELGYSPLNVLDSAMAKYVRALRGIQSCSTCEACRGAATRALGGAQRAVIARDAVHAMCKYLREECSQCPSREETIYGPGVRGCYAVAEETIQVAHRLAQPPGDG